VKDKFSTGMTGAKQLKTQAKPKLTPFPPEDRTNPYLHQTLEQFSTKSVSLKQPFRKVVSEL